MKKTVWVLMHDVDFEFNSLLGIYSRALKGIREGNKEWKYLKQAKGRRGWEWIVVPACVGGGYWEYRGTGQSLTLSQWEVE